MYACLKKQKLIATCYLFLVSMNFVKKNVFLTYSQKPLIRVFRYKVGNIEMVYICNVCFTYFVSMTSTSKLHKKQWTCARHFKGLQEKIMTYPLLRQNSCWVWKRKNKLTKIKVSCHIRVQNFFCVLNEIIKI